MSDLKQQAHGLGLHGLLNGWDELSEQDLDVVRRLVDWEETERQRRSLERRIRNARISRFKPLADFDWSWPESLDRAAVEELFTFQFLQEPANVVLVGPNGVGKSMIARNLAYQALLSGHTVRFTTASAMLNDLAAQDGASALQRRIRAYCRPSLLVVDEVGYLSYDNRHADLLFEIVTRRYDEKSIVITTNKPFGEWNEVFPNAACVVTLVDRLVHRAEIVQVQGESYRLKEAKERAASKAKKRSRKNSAKE
jgi:DNA replication protein DnaC